MPPKTKTNESSGYFSPLDISILAEKMGVVDVTVRSKLKDRHALANFRMNDLRIIEDYLREHKNVNAIMRGRRKQDHVEAIASIVFPVRGKGPAVSPLHPPTILYNLLQPRPFYMQIREIHTQYFAAPSSGTTFYRFDIKIPVRALFELLDGDETLVNGMPKKSRLVMYLYNIDQKAVIGWSAFQASPNADSEQPIPSITMSNRTVEPQPWEVKEGQQFDLTPFVNWESLKYQKNVHKSNNNNLGIVAVTFHIPKSLCANGLAAIWNCSRISTNELFARIYLDTINAYLEKSALTGAQTSLVTMNALGEIEEESITTMANTLHDRMVMDNPLPTKNSSELLQAPKDAEGEEEDEVQMGDQTLSFLDPLVLSRVKYPAKGKDCSHRECFDLLHFLRFHERKVEWRCAICSKVLTPETITIDTKFKLYLALNPNSDHCIVHSDGSTSTPASSTMSSSNFMTPRTNSKVDLTYNLNTVSGKKRTPEVVCIDLDSENEDESMAISAVSSPAGMLSPVGKRRKTKVERHRSSMSIVDGTEVQVIELSDTE